MFNSYLSFSCRASCYRVQFGDLKMIYDSEQTPILHDEEGSIEYFITCMEADLKIPGNIVLSIEDSLYTTDGETIQLIATQGNAQINAFYQLNASSIVVPERKKRCLLLFDRDSSKSSSLAGNCDSWTNNEKLIDGYPSKAETGWVLNIIRGAGREYSQNLFFIDYDVYTGITPLRSVYIDTQYVETLYRPHLRANALCWEYSTSNILIGGEFGITRLNLDKNTTESITFEGAGGPGHNNRPLGSAFLKPRGIINIVENMYVTASDFGIQVIDLANMYLHSVCTLSQSIKEGNITFCQTPSDVGTPLYFDGHLYFSVSTYYYVQIAQIEGKDFV